MTTNINTAAPTCIDVGAGLELWAHDGDVWVQLEDDERTSSSLTAAYFEEELADPCGGTVSLSRAQINQVITWDDEIDQ